MFAFRFVGKAILVGLIGTGCAQAAPGAPSTAVKPAHTDVFAAIGPALGALPAAPQIWSHKLTGLVTDLEIASARGSALVATAPDPETGEGSGFHTALFSAEGKRSWIKEVPARVRAMAIAADASIVILADYDDNVSMYDGRTGKLRWRVEDSGCRPTLVGSPQVVLCLHDDTVSPREAFVAFDLKGRAIGTGPGPTDSLILKTAGSGWVIASAGGKISWFDSVAVGHAPKARWDAKVAGEVIDLAPVSASRMHEGAPAGAPVSLVALVRGPQEKPELVWLDRAGHVLVRTALATSADQIELASDGTAVWVYGNTTGGQSISKYSLHKNIAEAAPNPVAATRAAPWVVKTDWQRGEKRPALYSGKFSLAGDLAIVAFEGSPRAGESGRLIGYGPEGDGAFEVDVPSADGAYIYAHGVSRDRAMVWVATDDSVLQAYRMPAR